MIRDLRHAVRLLLQARGWTAGVVLSLGLGIGANTALFSAVNGLLLKKVPVAEPDTLVQFKWVGQNDMSTNQSDYGFTREEGGVRVRATVSYAMYQQFVAENKTLSALIAGAPYGRLSVVVNGQADLGTAFIASGNYFQVLNVSANPGRVLIPEDDRADAPPVAVISHRYWQSRFGGDPAIVGKA